MPNGPNGNGWHLRKEISFSHIITTFLIVISVMKFGYDMDKRIALLEVRYDYTEATSHRYFDEINSKLEKINTEEKALYQTEIMSLQNK